MGIPWHPNSVVRTSNYYHGGPGSTPGREPRPGKLLGMPKIK